MKTNVYQVDFAGKTENEIIESFPHRSWLEAGIELLREKGPHALFTEEIAERMQKTVEDFHKEFKSFEEYMIAFFDFWYEKETLKYIELIDGIEGDTRYVFLTMVEILHDVDKEDEIAIRNMALRCPDARAALERVDRTRLDVGTSMFKEMGFSEKESLIRSKAFYTSMIGTEYTSISASLEQKLELAEILMNQD